MDTGSQNSSDHYNRGGFIAFIFSIVFSLGLFAYVSLFSPGIDLKEVPEAAAPGQTVAGGAPAVDMAGFDINKIEKPWTETPQLIAHGKEVFATNCAVCHGNGGLGDGPAGAALNPKPRNLVEGQWKKSGSQKDLFTTITDGLEGTSMASFKHVPKNDRWSLVHYVRSITKNKKDMSAADLEKFAASAQ